MHHLRLLGIALLLFIGTSAVWAQDTLQTKVNPYGSGHGFTLLLTNSGFGFGGYYRKALSETTSLVGEIMLGSGKDEREQKFITFWGQAVIPNKKNYLLIVPLQFGVQKRLFKETIRENFRPYIQLSGGPAFGWVSPYFRDSNGNGTREPQEKIYDSIGAFPKGKGRVGVGGTLALGAFFGFSKRTTQGVRLGYTFTYFFEAVELMETDVRPPQHYFGTPFISLVFGRIR